MDQSPLFRFSEPEAENGARTEDGSQGDRSVFGSVRSQENHPTSPHLPFVRGIWDENVHEMAFLNHCSWTGKAVDCLLPLRMALLFQAAPSASWL